MENYEDFIRGNACVRENGRELVKARSVSDFHANLSLSEGGRQSWVDDP